MHALTAVCFCRCVLLALHEVEVLLCVVAEELRARFDDLENLVRDLVREDEVAEPALRRFKLSARADARGQLVVSRLTG